MRTSLDIRKARLSSYIQFPISTNNTHLAIIMQLDSHKSSRRLFSSNTASGSNHDGSLIRQAVAAKNPEQAEMLLLAMHQAWQKGNSSHPSPPSLEQLQAVLQAWCHSRNPQRAKELLTKWGELSNYIVTAGALDYPFPNSNSVSYNMVIASFCKTTSPCEKSAQAAHALLDEMRDKYASGMEDMQPDTKTFNSVMSAWVRLGNMDQVLVVWNDLYSDYVKHNTTTTTNGKDYSLTANDKPDGQSFQSVLDGLAESRSNPEQAEELLKKMWELNVPPTTKHYNSVLHGWVRFQGYQSGVRAEALLAEMKRMSDQGQAGNDNMVPVPAPNVHSYSTTIAAWSKSGHQDAVNKVESILEDMLASSSNDRGLDLRPDTWCYNTVLRTISHTQVSNKAERASRIIRRMRANTAPSDSYTRELVRKCGSNWL
jgi:pentatricopeptide repeat protein